MNTELKSNILRAAEGLKEAGAKEVYIFGSAVSDRFHEGSDVDLAESGLPDKVFYQALGQAHGCLDRPLDLVDIDEDNPFTRYLKEEGELVRVA